MEDHFQNFLEEELFTKPLIDEKTHQLKEGERRNVAILFADLHGFTSLSESLDHEQVQDLIDKLMDILSHTILKYGGYVDKYSGDEIMALFGAKVASEVDTQRAIYCALEIHDKLKKFNAYLSENPPFNTLDLKTQMRIGINSGMVTAGRIGMKREGDFTVYGDVVNLASRLEKHAPVGKILVNNRTRRLVENNFEFESLGKIDVKGKSTPSSIYTVKSLKEEKQQLKDYQSPFIGHKKELKMINDIYNNSVVDLNNHNNSPILISISGDAGIGKSRLVFESIPHTIKNLGNKYFISSHATNVTKSPYYIFTHLIRNLINVNNGDTVLKLEDRVNEYFTNLEEYLPTHLIVKLYDAKPIIEYILGIKNKDVRLTLLGKELRVQIHRAIRILLSSACYKANNSGLPYIIILEDLHWIDDLSKEALIYLIETFNIDNHKINGHHHSPIFIFNHRNEYHIPTHLIKYTIYHKIELKPLSKRDCENLIKALLRGNKYNIEIIDELYDNSKGNPFFIEEWIYLLLKKSKGDLLTFKFDEDNIPDNINNLVLSRIDLLSDIEKHTLQCASILGNHFYTSTLQKMDFFFYNYADTNTNIDVLQNNKFISPYFHQIGIYTFNHIITCEVTYNTILNTNKKKIHAVAGEIIESECADNLSSNYYHLADHFYKGEVIEKAKLYSGLAAKQAKDIFDNKNSIHFYEEYIGLLGENEKNLRIVARIQLCEVFILIGDLKEAEGNLIGLKNEIDKDESILNNFNNIFADLGYIYHLLGNSVEAKKYIDLQLATCYGKDAKHYAFASEKMGKICLDLGDVETAKDYFNKTLDYYISIDSKIDMAIGYRNLAEIEFRLGNFDIAYEGFKNAYDMAGIINAMHEQSLSLGNMGIIHLIKGEFNRAIVIFNSVLDINLEMGDKIAVSQSYGNIGIGYKELKNYNEALEKYEEQYKICENISYKPGIALAINNIGLVYYKKNYFVQAKEHLIKALSINEEIGNTSEIAKVYGNLGMICKDMGEIEEALGHFKNSKMNFDDLGDKRFSALSLGDIGSLLFLKGNYNKAIKYLNKATKIFKQITDLPNYAKYQLLLGELFCETKDYNNSLTHLNRVEKVLSNIDGDESLKVEVKVGKTLINYHLNGNFDQLEMEMNKIIEKNSVSKENEASIHFELWKINQYKKSKTIAIKLYSELYKDAPKFKYKYRLDEMN